VQHPPVWNLGKSGRPTGSNLILSGLPVAREQFRQTLKPDANQDKSDDAATLRQINAVLNWSEEVKHRVPPAMN
jgi:hypothetical protein